MIAKKLKLKNFYSHTDTELVFDKSIYIILGKILNTNKSNGSGKSTIPTGIKYALYGDSTDSEKNARSLQVKGDALIYNNEDEMEVSFTFEMNGDDYTIRRVLKRGSTASVYIAKNKEKAIKHGVTAAQEIIEGILGANYEIFKNTSYFQQGDLNSFSKLTPKTAKDVVMQILQLDVYSDYELEAKDNVSLIKGRLQGLNNDIDTLEEMIEQQKEEQEESKYSEEDLKEVVEQLSEIRFHKKLQDFWENSKDKSIDELSNSREVIQTDLSKVNAEINLVDQRVKKLEKLSGVKACPTCEQELKKEDIEGIVTTLKTDVAKRSPKKVQLKETLDSLDESRNTIRSYTLKLYDEAGVIEKNQKLSEIKVELKKAKSDKSKLKDLEAKKSKLETGVKSQKTLLESYTKLQKAFGRKGIPAYIIENVIPEIETTANTILKGLDTAIRISIESQKDLKKGGKAETLDINVITEYGERPYANYSGGEKTLIDFSIRMSLSIILARRSNCQIQTLILDEVFGELDSVNKQIIANAIKYVAKQFDFKRIIVISHSEELQDTCKNVIRIKFDGKKSYVQTEK